MYGINDVYLNDALFNSVNDIANGMILAFAGLVYRTLLYVALNHPQNNNLNITCLLRKTKQRKKMYINDIQGKLIF